MKHHTLLFLAAIFMLSACQLTSDKQAAQQRVEHARQLVEMGMLNRAKIELDSVHILYRKEVAVRRDAKQLADSIAVLEAKRNLVYADSLLQILLPQTDPLLKKFRYEKNDKYEDHGKYVHKLLQTEKNTERCYLQAYVSDDRITTVKSYYYGAGTFQQKTIELTANEDVTRFDGKSHGFEAEGYHSILTFEDAKALEMLNFISANKQQRIRINLLGETAKGNDTNYIYYLSDNEKTALVETYQLGFLFSDIKRTEELIRVSNAIINKYML